VRLCPSDLAGVLLPLEGFVALAPTEFEDLQGNGVNQNKHRSTRKQDSQSILPCSHFARSSPRGLGISCWSKNNTFQCAFSQITAYNLRKKTKRKQLARVLLKKKRDKSVSVSVLSSVTSVANLAI